MVASNPATDIDKSHACPRSIDMENDARFDTSKLSAKIASLTKYNLPLRSHTSSSPGLQPGLSLVVNRSQLKRQSYATIWDHAVVQSMRVSVDRSMCKGSLCGEPTNFRSETPTAANIFSDLTEIKNDQFE